ncbi:AP-1 complex subunit gamma-1 [Monosporozyma unispora]|nr:clathrin associated protein complex large subunit [Kazachstania unispora]
MGSSLKSFIKDIRNAKTLADQRTIITKQSAKIRTKLRDDHLPFSKRRVNIQKLLYLYILGEPTHFAQVECINLIASDQFVDKRLGYLATMLLLDEKQDLLTLLTNLLNNDLHHPNKYIVSLALSTLGSLSSYELARDLYPDVIHLIETSSDPFILTKSFQCLAKLIIKDSELTILEIFPIELIKEKFLDSPNVSLLTHGVWLGICKVLQSIVILLLDTSIQETPEFILAIRENLLIILPNLLDQLSSLNVKNYESNYDVQGIRDPFLQCEIIITLKWIFKLAKKVELFSPIKTKYDEKFIDIFTQLTNNSSLSLNKNPTNAILYEVTRTIFELEMNQSLRLLGINILANFLKPTNSASGSTEKGKKSKTNSNNNNNIKYVALNTLIRVVQQEPNAIAKHKKFISHCLYDPDISIKFRSLELTFAILNKDNLIELVNELIKFLHDVSLNNVNSGYVYIDMDESKELINYTIDNLVKRFDLYDSNQEKVKLQNLFEILKLTGNMISVDKLNEFLITINNVEDWKIKINCLVENIVSHMQKGKIPTSNICWNLIMIWSIGEYGDSITNQSNGKISETQLVNYLIQLNTLYSNTSKSSIKNNPSATNNTYNDHITMIQYILTSSLKLSSKINDGGNIESLRQIILNHQKDPNLMLQLKSNQYEMIFNQPANLKKLMLECMPNFVRQIETNGDETFTHTISTKAEAPSIDKNSNLLDLLSDISDKPSNSTASSVKKEVSALTLPNDAVSIFNNDLLEIYSHVVDVQPGNAHYELFFKPLSTPFNELHSLCAVPKQQKLTLGQIQPTHNNIDVNQITKQSLKIAGTGKLKLRVKLNIVTGNNETQQVQFDHKFNETI